MTRRVLLLLVCIVALLGLTWPLAPFGAEFARIRLQSPKVTLREFYDHRERAEDQLIDPLVLAGPRIVPLIMAEVADTAMPLRRYAIGFLGYGRFKEARPLLERILGDTTELEYFRGDALLAIYHLDLAEGRRAAARYDSTTGFVGEIASDILTSRDVVHYRRTLWDAFWHTHN